MSLKEFLKSLSIYGILPVFTKFASFLLVPIYVRVFSSAQFGIVELIVSSVHFVIFAMNLEFYGAVGRFFFERPDLESKRKLISSGLIMTIGAGLVIMCLGFLMQKQISLLLFKSLDYTKEMQVGLVWAFIAAISTYLSVLPRYLKKARQYVTYNAISLVIKLASTIFYVVVLRLGVMGAVLGNLTGAIASTLLYASASISYLRPVFSISDSAEVSRFALPLVPGLLIVGLYQPAMRTVLSRVYSIQDLGLFSFALKLVTIMALVQNSIKLSWKPMLYENLKKDNFGKEYLRISGFVGKTLLSAGLMITIFAPELVRLIGTPEYYRATQIVGFLVIGNIFANLISLRGFGFEVAKKTYMITLVSLLTSLLGLAFLSLVAPKIGFVGIGLAFAVPNLVSYLINYFYTQRIIKVKANLAVELVLWGLLLASSMMLMFDAPVYLRMLFLIPMLISLNPKKLYQSTLRAVKHV